MKIILKKKLAVRFDGIKVHSMNATKTETEDEIKTQLKALFQCAIIIKDAIREVKEIPSGHLYSMLMPHMSLGQYQRIIQILKDANQIEEKNHLLIWIGESK